jgi:iron complex transport system permease protein
MHVGEKHTASFMKHLRKNKIKIAYIYLFAVALLFASALLGILLGASGIGFKDIAEVIHGGVADSTAMRILRYVRLPRVFASLVCGAALAVSGAVIQSTLANRLASPSIIGVNAGAGLAVTLCSAFGIIGGFGLSFFSFIGAFAAVMIVSLGAKKWGASRGTVILMGVALNSLLGAVSDTVITFVPDVSIMSNDFRVGDFSSVTPAKLIPASVVILLGMAVLLTLSNELDVLTLGDENAKGLGQNTVLMRVLFLLLSALLAGAAVSVAGLLSFVGLIVPHMVRRIATNRSKHLLPLCGLFGAGFVTLCDTVSRILFAPYELPVGIIMAFIGAPLFIFILIKGKGEKTGD